MRTLLLPFAAALVLTIPSSGVAATITVRITAGGFSPKTLTLNDGDTVTWTNADKATHQVVANNGIFASGALKTGQSYSYTFKGAGKFNYHDALKPSLTGTITVKGPPASVTLGVAAPIVNYGDQTTITGTVSSGKTNETVYVNSQPWGSSVQQIATLMTGANGTFTYTIAPTIYTTYSVKWGSAVSPTIIVQVRPRITLARTGASLYARVSSSQSYAGRHIYLQRHSPFGQWVTEGKLKLGPLGGRIFKIPQRVGTSYYRVYMTTNQAGLGYLETWSNTVKVTVKKTKKT
jgi:plastocyanin